MSTAVKNNIVSGWRCLYNQIRVCLLSVKYNIMREMLNKVSFISNILFMMLNDASFIIQWLILFHLKEDIGGYSINEVMLLWGLSASSYGLSKIFFARVFSLPDLIINGKLDSYLVLPKNVLLSIITSATSPSAIGDFLYGLLVVCIFCFSIRRFILFLLFSMTGAVIITAFALLMGSLTFWFVRSETFGYHMISSMITFATYPDGIFNNAVKFILYLIIPVGMAIYQPVHIMLYFNARMLLMVLGYAFLLSTVSILVFYRGLRRYSSGSLMEAKV